jgi:hypothetical protein
MQILYSSVTVHFKFKFNLFNWREAQVKKRTWNVIFVPNYLQLNYVDLMSLHNVYVIISFPGLLNYLNI